MIEIIPALDTDRWIRSDHFAYQNALGSATNIKDVYTDDIGVVGQTFTSGTYYIRQYFLQFDYDAPEGQTPVAGYFRLQNSVTHGTNVPRATEIRSYNWTAPLTTSNWRTPALGLEAADVAARIQNSHTLANNSPVYAGFMRVRGELGGGSTTLGYVVATDRNRRLNAPSGVEYNSFRSTRTADPAHRPELVVAHLPKNRLTTVLSSQVQLSDGSWIVLERDASLDDSLALTVKRRTSSGAESTIYAFPAATGILENDNFRGAQGFGLCRDKNDNFFIIRPSYNNTNQIQIRPFIKGSGTAWSLGGELSFTTLADHGYSNVMQVACAWHDVGSGRIVVFATRDWSEVDATPDAYYLLDAQRILNGQSGFVLDSGRGSSRGFTARPPAAGPGALFNGTGTLCDIVAAPDHERVGYLLTGERHALLGENNTLSMGRYFIHSDGNQFNSFTFAEIDTPGGRSLYVPEAKARVLPLPGLGAAKVTADNRGEWGITVDRFSYNTNNNNYSRVARIRLGSESISSMPISEDLAKSAAWDAVYFPADNRIWVYYFNKDNNRQLMRVSVSLDDNLAASSTPVVVATVGASGDTIPAIRVQRNSMNSDYVLVTVALEDEDGLSHRYQYVTDRINLAPTQPTLHHVSNFNATLSRSFSWTFNDPNIVDSQSARQLQILRQSDSVVVFDTGMETTSSQSFSLLAGSIPNNQSYYWQVRTRDSAGVNSPWSSQGAFATSDSGIVTIVSPAVDNEEIFTKDVFIDWTLTGVPSQEEFQVKVTRTSDGVEHPSSTGWVTSLETSYTVTDLVSDVEYLVEVTCRNAGILSNTDTRLVTVHYSTPELPEVALVVVPDQEYVEVAVTNPEPRGDRPNPTINEVYRRVAGESGPFQYVGECLPNGVFRDYTVGSGYRYEYKVRAGVEQ